MSEEPKHESTHEEEWPEPLSRAKRDALDEATWKPKAVRVWPAGVDPDGPGITLTEYQEWQAEQKRVRYILDEVNRAEGDTGSGSDQE